METVDQPLQGMLSLLLRCDLSKSTSFEAYLFLSQEDDEYVRDIGKHDFLSVLLHPILFKANRPADERRVRAHFVTLIQYCIHELQRNLELHFST